MLPPASVHEGVPRFLPHGKHSPDSPATAAARAERENILRDHRRRGRDDPTQNLSPVPTVEEIRARMRPRRSSSSSTLSSVPPASQLNTPSPHLPYHFDNDHDPGNLGHMSSQPRLPPPRRGVGRSSSVASRSSAGSGSPSGSRPQSPTGLSGLSQPPVWRATLPTPTLSMSTPTLSRPSPFAEQESFTPPPPNSSRFSCFHCEAYQVFQHNQRLHPDTENMCVVYG